MEWWLPGLVPNGHRITVEHLLSHRSGLYNFTDSPRFEWTQEWIPNDLLALATTESPVHAPGTHSSYSNTNYVLLGLMVERVTGRHLATVVQQRVFDVAEMSDSSMTPGRVTESPRVHGYDGRRDVTLDDLSSIYGAGDAVSSARDLDAFVQALTAGRLLDATTFVQMTRSRGGLGTIETTPTTGSASLAGTSDAPRWSATEGGAWFRHRSVGHRGRRTVGDCHGQRRGVRHRARPRAGRSLVRMTVRPQGIAQPNCTHRHAAPRTSFRRQSVQLCARAWARSSPRGRFRPA